MPSINYLKRWLRKVLLRKVMGNLPILKILVKRRIGMVIRGLSVKQQVKRLRPFTVIT